MSTPPLSEWFVVTCDDTHATLSVNPPGGEAWTQAIAWNTVIRVCFKAGGVFDSDEYYVFTSERPESHVVPNEAAGAAEFLDALMARNLFPAEVAIEATALGEGELLCWPGVEEKRGK